MLLAVEGGGFFSASASGYSKGLSLLLLGQKKEEKPMRVSPWNQYQLVDQKSDPDLQLASTKNRLICGCASFVCFGRAAAGLETPSPLKAGPNQKQHTLSQDSVSDKGKDHIHTPDLVEDDNNATQIALKSSLKKPINGVSICSGAGNACEALSENNRDILVLSGRRKVQWTDASGGELVEIREFESSDTGGSDDEPDNAVEKTCSCKIM